MISISRRMLTMSCSSLIFSFRIDLMATWKEQIDGNMAKIQLTFSVFNINIVKSFNCVFTASILLSFIVFAKVS